MKKTFVTLALLASLASCAARPAYTQETTPAPMCNLTVPKVYEMSKDMPQIKITSLLAKSAFAFLEAVSGLSNAGDFGGVDEVLIVEMSGDASTWVGLVKGECVVASTVMQREQVSAIVREVASGKDL